MKTTGKKESLPKRKPNRSPEIDYSANASYFITMCTKGKECSLGRISGGDSQCKTVLSEYGRAVDEAIRTVPERYGGLVVESYVIMPNHVHILLGIVTETPDTPSISRVIQQLKGAVTKKIGKPIWQKSFYDHVARNDDDHGKILEYIESNPAKWQTDKYFL